MAVLAIIMAQSSLVYAVDAPPSLENPFGDAVDDEGDAPPVLALADDEDPDPTPTPIPTPIPDDGDQHNAANIPKSGPETYFLLLLLAFSLAGGHLYRLKKERN